MEPKIIDGGLAVDDRGCLSFVNGFDFADVKRFYVVQNHQNPFVRAWHGHRKEGKYVYVVEGSILIGVMPLDVPWMPDMDEYILLKKFVLSARKPQILYIPPGNYNGFMTLEPNTKIIFFSTSTLEESKGDDIRQPHDKWNIWKVEQR